MDVLFVCVGNAARSQMAKGFYNALARSTRAESAGTEPARRVSSRAVRVMAERGIDISGEKPKLLTEQMVESAKLVVSMGCLSRASCPAFLARSSKLVDWALPDPKDGSLEDFRRVRDEIERRVVKLVEDMEG
ncbi:MAG: arsenate reductase ArsC [Euryarchaeota archaeon]|nr:arsenate reductase ArsC [Euryarchaeota archaeon]